MTKEELNTFEDKLANSGYKKYDYNKTSQRTKYEWMKTIDDVIVCFRLWDFTQFAIEKLYDFDVCFVDSLEYTRADLILTNPVLDIEYVERIASAYRKFNIDNVYTNND